MCAHARTHARTHALPRTHVDNQHRCAQAKRPRTSTHGDLEEAMIEQVDKLKDLEIVANAMHVPKEERLLHAAHFPEFLRRRRQLIVERLQQDF